MSLQFSGNSIQLKNVYILSTGTVCGPTEGRGPLGQCFDYCYDDLYCGESSFEKAERKMLRKAFTVCLNKAGLEVGDISLCIGGDLMNQLTSCYYLAREIPKPFVGVYGACSTFVLSMIMGALYVEAGFMNYIAALTSSHNATAERQFRFPMEYGVEKKVTTTFTATGAIATVLTQYQTDVRVESITFGRVIDYLQNDPQDMGRAMAPAAFDTLKTHFSDLNRSFDDYDLVVTGDLSSYGHDILLKMFEQEHIRVHSYNDCGCMLYDLKHQNVYQGGSGCACSGLVTMGYLYSLLKSKKYKRILVVATGALLSPMMCSQKETIPCVAHAMSLEVVR